MTQDQWAEDAPIGRRNAGCITAVAVLIVGALVVTAIASFVESLAVDAAVLVVVGALGFGLMKFFRGPPQL